MNKLHELYLKQFVLIAKQAMENIENDRRRKRKKNSNK